MAWRFIESVDDTERHVIIELTNKAIKVREVVMRNQATMIASEVSKLFKK